MIKNLLSLGIVACIILSSCSIMNQQADRQNLGESTWKLIAIKQNRENLGDKAILKFDVKKNEVSGVAACNSFTGEIETIRNLITFADIASTKMYCEGKMDEEIQILSNLEKVSRFEVKSDILYLYSKDELLLTYKR
ncbi:META domain-containing protein [Daejeonella oryzae]|uniref:META domain-containing protein n=1 Tax=Daejeonella oryzae TaxID=1122943 RepID=UPI00047A7C1B|nr:META domain-containing protein [Daejeonella oryzae]